MNLGPHHRRAVATSVEASLSLAFACFTSCVGGFNRRPVDLLVSLEYANRLLGVDSIDTRVSASPRRDFKTVEERGDKTDGRKDKARGKRKGKADEEDADMEKDNEDSTPTSSSKKRGGKRTAAAAGSASASPNAAAVAAAAAAAVTAVSAAAAAAAADGGDRRSKRSPVLDAASDAAAKEMHTLTVRLGEEQVRNHLTWLLCSCEQVRGRCVFVLLQHVANGLNLLTATGNVDQAAQAARAASQMESQLSAVC